MRLLRLATVALAGLALAPSVAAARAPLCQDRSGRELAHSAKERVLEKRQASVRRRGDTDVTVLACRFGSRAATVLYRSESRDDLVHRAQDAAITPGRFVVVAIAGATASAGWVDIDQYDLRTGARRATVHRCAIGALWAGTSGGFAFEGLDGTATVVDAAGPRSVGGVGSQDFALGGDTLYWTDTGGVRSTALRGAPRGTFGADVDCG